MHFAALASPHRVAGDCMAGAFIAVDWGTTNRRAYRIEAGEATGTERDPLGVGAMAGRSYPAALAELRTRLGDLPVLMAGMVGSTIGWCEAPYAPLPATTEAVAGRLLLIDERTAIVPGLAVRDGGRCDVMRGEEVQLLGAVNAGLAPSDALLCQPGTHCKWAAMRGGAVVDFTTAMTGELFALLRAGSVLSAFLQEPVTPGEAFRAGAARGAAGDLAAALFGVRAAGVLGELPETEASSFASGVLIGSDVAPRLAACGGEIVHILADAALGALYQTAIEALGGRAVLVDSELAFVAGINAIKELWG